MARPQLEPKARLRTSLPSLLSLLAAALLVASLFVGWYDFRFDGTRSDPSGNAQFFGEYTFYPGLEFRTAAACSGNDPFCSGYNASGFTGTHPYAAPGPRYTTYLSIGHLYLAVEGLVVAAAVVAAGGALIALRSGNGGRSARAASRVLIAVALLIAAAAPVTVFLETGPAAKSDYHTPPDSESANFSGPAGSFWGSCSQLSCGSGGGITDSWGPEAGWYLGLASAALLAAGVALSWRSSRARARGSATVPLDPDGAT